MYRIGICDDEKGTCANLENIIYKFGDEHGFQFDIDVWYSGEKLCEYLKQKNSLDIIFLDINLVSMDGIKVGTFIRDELENMETDIIYISSDSSYAMSLFKLQPMDFLLKPLTEEKIEDVLLRTIKQRQRKKMIFNYQIKGNFYQVCCNKIIYFYSDNKKITIVTKIEKIIFNGKLKEIMPRLPYNFIQIHQSIIVNLDYVKECTYEYMVMQDEEKLYIS